MPTHTADYARKSIYTVTLIILSLSGFGCGLGGGPRARWGFTPDCCFGDPDKLGTHSYTFSSSEGYGILYTLRGGSIDPDHLRGSADMARYTYGKAYDTIMKRGPGFSVSPAFEWTTNTVRIDYPADWDSLSATEKQKRAHEAALIIAPVVAYGSSVWHEMITWKGTHFALIEPEHTSAFSWDDLYSNITGINLAMQIVQNGNVSNEVYDSEMTRLINEKLAELQVMPKAKAMEITESVRGSWYGGGKLTKRNMDIGIDDGLITPSIIPGYTSEKPISIPMPTLDGLDKTGIKITYTISSAYFENGKLKKMAGTKSNVQPLGDYPTIMSQIEQEAIEKYNYTIR